MTLESCASDCAGYTYFGVEYARECKHRHGCFGLILISFQVIVGTASLLALSLLPLAIAALRVLEIQLRSVERGIGSQFTKALGLELELPQLLVVAE